MKINEKNLCAYSTSSSPIDKEGWLCKRGELNKGYQKRWFVLKGNLLFYFDRKVDKEPVGVIILEGCTIELAENDDQFSFKIVFHGPNNRSYILGADSQECMEQWMKALACASYDYMKLMVADLQRQLKELEHTSNHESLQLPKDQITQSNESCERTSPHPPPRGRHNPFNKPISQSPQRKDIVSHRIITFKELHNQLGRSILRDRNEWRFGLNKQNLTNEEPLINL
ncbi:sesquipedalian-1-like [Daktulosphaira vitifoliae]|uniref:sesquipedalian-1-like n=1 Tax=Daktulosphaira vitifoliae TaxID=58002 RepID=UPI0021AAE6EE|nr:sesquipedalian-1-like [Daktulosphaira vitifoliae]